MSSGAHRRAFFQRTISVLAVAVAAVAVLVQAKTRRPPWQSGIDWPVPPVVDPGPPGGAPSDAIVLFDGKDLSAFSGAEKWEVRDGYAICGGSVTTRQAFGDFQLHLEWASPPDVESEGQARGNSGVYIMGMYEVQILDSYRNETYPDGQAAAVYKQHPPYVNVCRKPGEWQVFDIIWRGPRWDEAGNLLRRACVTILHNGVVVLDGFELLGRSGYRTPPYYAPHPEKLPFTIQYHKSPVRFRNIWVRELPDRREDLVAPVRARLATQPH